MGVNEDFSRQLCRWVRQLSADFNCERTSVYVRDADGRFVTLVAQGLTGMTIDVKPGEGLAGKCLACGQPLLANAAAYDTRSLCRLRDHYTGFVTRSLLVVPVKNWRGKVVALVQLVNKTTGPFAEDDIEKLQAAARPLAALVKRVRRPVRNVWREEADDAAEIEK